jgi:hypothetical protein
MEAEARLRESDNLMDMLRRTEHEINHIVDRGQTALQERKNSRMTSDPSVREPSGGGRLAAAQNAFVAANSTSGRMTQNNSYRPMSTNRVPSSERVYEPNIIQGYSQYQPLQ